MKIRTKLSGLLFLVLFLIVTVLCISSFTINKLQSSLYTQAKINNPLNISLLKLKYNVVQIQQWLTDISATKGAEGFDDGFNEAEKYYSEAKKVIGDIKNYNIEDSVINDLNESLDEYYKMGIEMANTYISKGTEEGNVYMEKFDPYAENITTKVESLAQKAASTAKVGSENLQNDIKNFKMQSTILYISIILIVIVALVIIRLVIINRLSKLAKNFENIAEGEGDLTLRINDNSSDEIGDISRCFNTFVEKIHNIIYSVKQMSEESSNTSEKISIITSQLTETIEQVAQSTNSVSDNISKETEFARKIMSEIEESSDQVKVGNMTVKQSEETVLMSDELSLKGKEIVNGAVAKFEEIKDDIDKTKITIEKLRETANNIGDIIGIISNISSQTNLLALNASIEAARAGEAGRGFAVVADEVRKLAEESEVATGKISKLISDIQIQTSKSVEIIEKNASDMIMQAETIGNVNKVMEEASDANQLLLAKTNNVSIVFNKISTKMEGIVDLFNKILYDIENTSESSEEVAAATEEQLSSIEDVANEMNNMKKLAQSLNEKVSSFKIEKGD